MSSQSTKAIIKTAQKQPLGIINIGVNRTSQTGQEQTCRACCLCPTPPSLDRITDFGLNRRRAIIGS